MFIFPETLYAQRKGTQGDFVAGDIGCLLYKFHTQTVLHTGASRQDTVYPYGGGENEDIRSEIKTDRHEYVQFPNLRIFFPVALQPFWTLAASYTGGFLNYFRHMVGLLGRVISPSKGLYLHRTTQHRKTRTNNHALSGTRTQDPSNQPAKTHASDRTATVTGNFRIRPKNINNRNKNYMQQNFLSRWSWGQQVKKSTPFMKSVISFPVFRRARHWSLS
jgi:hypothetical protein